MSVRGGRSRRIESARSDGADSFTAPIVRDRHLACFRRRAWSGCARPFGEQIEQSGFNFLELRFEKPNSVEPSEVSMRHSPRAMRRIFVDFRRRPIFCLAGEVMPPVGGLLRVDV